MKIKNASFLLKKLLIFYRLLSIKGFGKNSIDQHNFNLIPRSSSPKVDSLNQYF